MLLKDLFKYTIEYGVYHGHGKWTVEKLSGYVAADSEDEAYRTLMTRWGKDIPVYSIKISHSIGLVDIATKGGE